MPTTRSANQRGLPSALTGRSVWFTAAWTGVGTALAAAVTAVVAVALLWLPAAGDAGSAGSVLRAGLITFVASLHGGVTVDGLDAGFLPLGLLAVVAAIAWRSGRGLAAAAQQLGESDPQRLAMAGGVQALGFAVTTAVLAALSPLGTSSASIPGAFLAGLIVFTVVGGTALARGSSLGAAAANAVPDWTVPVIRAAAAAVTVYLVGGGLLVACSLIAHHREFSALTGQVGGGWSAVPVLLLCVLAAPNAAIAGASYLAGPGFAIGSGTTVALGSTPHGRVPAFPILGALPHGTAGWPGWTLAVLTALGAGFALARVAARTANRWQTLGYGALAAGLLAAVLAWQGGGGIGSGRLHVVGVSPWQLGFVVVGETLLVGALGIGLARVADVLRRHGRVAEPEGVMGSLLTSIGASVEAAAVDLEQAISRSEGPAGADERPKTDKLAG